MDNLFDGGGLVSTNYDIGNIDFSAAGSGDVVSGGGGVGDFSSGWGDFFKTGLAKGLDYFIAKDAAVTRASLPGQYPMSYVRGADGRLYQSNGTPLSAIGAQPVGSNNLLMIVLVVGGVLLLKKA